MADAQVRIFHLEKEEFIQIVACVAGRKRPRVLEEGFPGTSAGGGGSRHFILNGFVLAYEEWTWEQGSVGKSWVVAENLRTGKKLHEVPTHKPPSNQPNTLGVGSLYAIVATAKGDMAWLSEELAQNEHEPPVFAVRDADSTGAHLLAAGTDIDPHSLALAGSVVYWTEGGKPYSAMLK